jgi:hypothetical protein
LQAADVEKNRGIGKQLAAIRRHPRARLLILGVAEPGGFARARLHQDFHLGFS